MDEEKQNDGLIQKTGAELNKGVKKQQEKSKRKFFKKVVEVIVPILLKVIAIGLIAFIIWISISNFLDKIKGETSKEAMSSTVDNSATATEESSNNRIIVDINNTTTDGAYILTYEFKDEDGNVLSEEKALKNIKDDLLNENPDLKISNFSDSEIKVLGALMYNGLKVEKYNEEELKALVIFVKADIAGRNFDLRKEDKIGQEIDAETMLTSDEVYGTLQVGKTKIAENPDGTLVYTDEKLEYVPYGDSETAGTFCYMDEHDDVNLLNKFSVNEEGNLVIAGKMSSTITYTYKDEKGNNLSKAKIEKNISQDNIRTNISKTTIREVEINHQNHIKRYILSYGILSDLLVTTKNVDFCLDLAQLGFNSKVVINATEERSTTHTESMADYTQTTLLYDYVKYVVSGQEENTTTSLRKISEADGNPSISTDIPSQYGWSSSKPSTETGEYGRTIVYNWIYEDIEYQLKYINISTYQHWTLYEKVQTTTQTDLNTKENKNKEDGDLIANEHEDALDEDYTAQEVFKYTLVTVTDSENTSYTTANIEVDNWYLKREKQYTDPVKEGEPIGDTIPSEGVYPEEATIVIDKVTDQTIINNDEHVIDFIKDIEKQYTNENAGAVNVKCNVTELTVKEKVKLDSVETYTTKVTRYKFGEEVADNADKLWKNIEYINNQASFTPEGPAGFLYIYDNYLQSGVDLFLQDDAEKNLFELLELESSDLTTSTASEIIKYLLYVYDGIDRGVTDFEFKVYDITINNMLKFSPFGCKLSREEFIAKAQEKGDSVISRIAGDFYDICTKEEYNVNPCVAYAWAALESGFGRNAPGNNLFGMAVYNGADSGTVYSSYADSIEDFCKWVVAAATPGTSSYNGKCSRGGEFATVNSIFEGTPESNGYVLFCNYMSLGSTHMADEKSYHENDDEREKYYQDGYNKYFNKQNVNMSGSGGRMYIYEMYEKGGLYEGEYDFRCGMNPGHSKASDPTTLQEQADYAQYSIQKRINIAKSIFGNDCIYGGGSIVETAYQVADHFLNSGVDVYYANDSVERVWKKNGKNGRTVKGGNIKASWDDPIEHPESCGIVCGTFVSLTIWKAGLVDEETINKCSYHGVYSLEGLLKSLDGWQIITNWDELEEGDIVTMTGHIFIYMEGDKCLDQHYCAISASGTDLRGQLLDASKYRSQFRYGFRYVG